ncbi:MAG: hypothetical protein JWN76_1867 [Chitinophagaceae bacterium]|nr:hypothetical protein [Chitinophagaceae bacterium]
MLYNRDFRKLTDEEKSQHSIAEEYYKSSQNSIGIIEPGKLINYHNLLPDAVYYYKTLFPNNFLSTREFHNSHRISQIKEEFISLLDANPSELDVLNFIKNKEAYFIIGSILKSYYNFGHHNAFAFREFELSSTFKADYLLVGKNSGGHEFVFIELESPNGAITMSNGSFGTVIRKGVNQVTDWDSWLDTNFHSLRLVFSKYLGESGQLPKEFTELDKSRIHYVVVAGRRKNFTAKTYQLRRKNKNANNILILHFDNLIDGIDLVLKSGNY